MFSFVARSSRVQSSFPFLPPSLAGDAGGGGGGSESLRRRSWQKKIIQVPLNFSHWLMFVSPQSPAKSLKDNSSSVQKKKSRKNFGPHLGGRKKEKDFCWLKRQTSCGA